MVADNFYHPLEMAQIGSGTFTKDAVAEATKHLSAITADADKMIILITDGVPSSGQEPQQEVVVAGKLVTSLHLYCPCNLIVVCRESKWWPWE